MGTVQKKEIRQRPTLPLSLPSSTIGAEGLNFRVRNGNGWIPLAMATGKCKRPAAPHLLCQRPVRVHQYSLTARFRASVALLNVYRQLIEFSRPGGRFMWFYLKTMIIEHEGACSSSGEFLACPRKKSGQAARLISIGKLHVLPRFHTRPINLVVYKEPSGGLPHGISYLGVGFPLRCFQRLSLPNVATQRCRWRDNWYTSGSSIPVLSY